MKILLVENDPATADLLSELLRDDPASEVQKAADGAQADLLLSRGLVPDAVVCCLMIPDVDGVAFIQALHGKLPAVRIVVMTSLGEEEVAKARERLGDIPVLRKPFDVAELKAALLAGGQPGAVSAGKE